MGTQRDIQGRVRSTGMHGEHEDTWGCMGTHGDMGGCVEMHGDARGHGTPGDVAVARP